MDDKRRRELEQRRAAMHTQTPRDHAAQGPIVAQLRARSVAFESTGSTIWIPSYLPIGSSQIDWQRVDTPSETRDYRDVATRPAVVRELLELLPQLPERLTIAYHASLPTLTLVIGDALAHLDVLLDELWQVYIYARPAEWIIECGRYGTASLLLPPEPDPAKVEEAEARRRAYAAPLWRAFAASGETLQMFDRSSAAAPEPSHPVNLNGWQQRAKSLKALVDRGDTVRLEQAIRPWLEARAPGDTPLLVCLRYEESPLIVLPANTLLDHVEGLMKMTDRFDLDAPGGEIVTKAVLLFDPQALWRLHIYVTGPYWRAEGAD